MKTQIANSQLIVITKSNWFRPAQLLLAITVLCLTIATLNTARAEDGDPASRVARISYLKGRVFLQPAEADAWTEARINRPLTSGDQLWTEANSRSELQIGSATLQIDANTQLRLLELSDTVLQIEVSQGLVNMRVRSLSKRDTVELDTPNAAITVMEPGTYRVEVADNDDTTLIQVRDGSADVAGERQSFTLNEDEQLSLQGTRRLAAAFDDLPRMDEFDRWASERNQRAERVNSSRYVASGVIGYEDLDDYGNWRWYQDYGYVWQPTRIVSGWAPYRYGNWAWVSPWGWTWVDDAPWGFAPFHYGRWATVNNRWCWVPGPRNAPAVYAPALVAWLGTPGLSVSVNIGSQPVGWIPLGPREVYRPYYRGSERYVLNINISNSLLNNTEFERGYRRQPHEDNFGNRNAMSVVSAGALSAARPVSNNLLRGDNGRLQAIATAPITRPDITSMLGGERRATPPQLNSREVFARRQPNRPTTNNTINNGGGINVQTTPRDSGRDAAMPARDNIRVVTPTTRRGEANSPANAGQPRNNNEPGQGPNSDGNSRAGSSNTQPRNERSTVNTPYIRPATPATTRPELNNPGSSRTLPADNTGSAPNTNNTDNNPARSAQPVTPTTSPRNSSSPGSRTFSPDTSGTTERGARNNSWVRDEAPLRRSAEPQVQTPSAPAVSIPRNEPAPREERQQSQPEPAPQQAAPAASNPATSVNQETGRMKRREDRLDTR